MGIFSSGQGDAEQEMVNIMSTTTRPGLEYDYSLV